MEAKKQLDVLVIGSGPAGLTAAIYAKRANLSVLLAEKEYLGTGQIAESGRVDNYPGMAGINGYDLGEAFRAHAEGLGVEFYEGEACGYEKTETGFLVTFTNAGTLEAKTVIYCAGAAHRHLHIPGEEELAGKGVSYCAVCDGAFYKGKTAVVIGGGDTALDDAHYLSDLCEKVYLIHRRDEFRGSANTLMKLREKENVELITGARPKEICGREQASAILLQDGRRIETDGVFIAVGMEPQAAPLAGFVELDENGYIAAGETGETSVRGFFAAGDVRTKPLRQVVTAVADGANAATAAAAYLAQCD